MLSGISQTEKEKYCIRYLLYVESKKYNKLVNVTTKKKQIPRCREQASDLQQREGTEEGQYRCRGEKKRVTMGLQEMMISSNHLCETFENCKAQQNLKTVACN